MSSLSAATVPVAHLSPSDKLYRLSELAEMGYGSKRSNQKLIARGVLPAVRVGNIVKVRESDLHLLTAPLNPSETGGQ